MTTETFTNMSMIRPTTKEREIIEAVAVEHGGYLFETSAPFGSYRRHIVLPNIGHADRVAAAIGDELRHRGVRS